MIFTTFVAAAAPLGASPSVSPSIYSDTTIGAVHQSKGKTFARSNTISVAYAKNKGDMVGAGEILSTGKNSSMTVKFMDSTIMTLGSDAEVEVDELVFNPNGKAKDNHIVISLAEGTYYYVSGKIKKENVTILTPTATIGI
ncbi:MAG: FecR domain-containing protein, partial [Rhodospirillaceae bacterium]|nr:FecR domain-containing protein [Rhodospirillaceae bacterium]